METTRLLMTSYGRLIEETFENESLRTALVWLAAQSGPPPTETASGDFAGWQGMIHKHGAWRAKGGSGALTRALAARLEAWQGDILTEAAVTSIQRKSSGGFEVNTADGVHHARAVVGACHVQTLMLDLLDPELTGPELRKRVSHIRVGNGFGMVVRHAVEQLPRYPGESTDDQGRSECHSALQLLCPSREYLQKTWIDYLSGRPPAEPAVLAMTFSALDPGLAPPGKHVLFAWAQYHPYELSEGPGWDERAAEEADKIYDVVCRYAPNMKGAIIDRYIQTPLEIERLLGLRRANVMHVEMSFDQMFTFRPLPEMSDYRTPIPGVYLTGASTHPGGGVFGASGRNASRVVLRDL